MIAVAILLIVLIGATALFIPVLQVTLKPLFAADERLQGLRSLFVTLGGALLGATAIVSSLVLFSMQVNVERMPYGLFRRLSGDRRLLSAFGAAFLLALILAALSLIPDTRLIGFAAFGACWAIALILMLFLYGYRRALVLISPLRQLGIVFQGTRREFRAWVRRANRAAPLLATRSPSPDKHNNPSAPTHDMARLAYLQANAHWTAGARQAVGYAISIARRYAEQGDHEVSSAAMNTIIAINAAYVEAKGTTFFTYQLLIENPLTSDSFISDTLEHLRQTARIAVSRGDEQQIEQTLRTFAGLVHVYAAIDYGSQLASKTHAHLAAGYLTERIVRENMPDVLMEGVRVMGKCAVLLLVTEGPNGIATLAQKLGVIGCCGIAREDYRAVTLTCVEQLGTLDFNLLRIQSKDIGFAAKQVRSSIALITKVFLTVPDTPLTSTHSTFLGPYYSVTGQQAFLTRLVALVNAIAEQKSDDKDAQQVIHNIKEWADGLYAREKETLLVAIERRSQFTLDMIYWITRITGVLIFLSKIPACDARTQEELRKHALWLVSVLSFIPEDLDTIQFVENFQLTERLFETALDAHRRECPEMAANIMDLLVSWMFKGGQVQSGWAILEESIYGLAVLALLAEADGAIPKLKADLAKRLAAGGLPDQAAKDHAALEIRARAATLYRQGHLGSAIDALMAQADHTKLEPLLEELANLISPGTVGRAARHAFF